MEDREKTDGSDYTWSDYTNKVTSMLLARHVDATTIICIKILTTSLNLFKDDERESHIQGQQRHIPNVYMKPTDKFPSARDFKTFLCSSINKKRLQTLIKSQLSKVAQSIHQSGAALRAYDYNDPVVIDAADTDVYIQAAAISHDVPGVICIKKKKELYFCRGMCMDEDIAKCLIQFHVTSGCDANSRFYSHGKTTLYDKMAKSIEAHRILSKCGESLPLNEDVFYTVCLW